MDLCLYIPQIDEQLLGGGILPLKQSKHLLTISFVDVNSGILTPF
jgi:hypothetical protein